MPLQRHALFGQMGKSNKRNLPSQPHFPKTTHRGQQPLSMSAAVTCQEIHATVDSGAHRILLSQMWECYAPRRLMQSSALCTMGCAIPLAIGAHFIEPYRTVVSFCGEAGFLMVAGELTTAKELSLNTIFVVFVDASLALKQRQRQLTNNGVDFARHDFAAMGNAFGGNGHTVHTRDELRVALKAAQKAQEFTVIAAVIEKGAYDARI
jgi:acetolactate synthase-1/2/3 large subunit